MELRPENPFRKVSAELDALTGASETAKGPPSQMLAAGQELEVVVLEQPATRRHAAVRVWCHVHAVERPKAWRVRGEAAPGSRAD